MTLIQRVELLAEDVKKLEGEGGGGDLSAYLTKDEASNTYETQSAASSALALKADKATTYTKSEVDSAIAGISAPEPVVIPLNDTYGVFPADKYYVLEQHLPFKLSESSTNILYFDKFSSSNDYYYYSNRDALDYVMSVKVWTNNNTYRYEVSQKQGGGVISYITQANLLRNLLSYNTHAVLNTQSSMPDYVSLPDNIDLNTYTYYSGIYYRQNSFTSIANCPVSEPFYMIDETLSGDGNTHNFTLFLQKNPTCFYKRTRYLQNGQKVFTDWQKFSCDSEILNETSVSANSYASLNTIPTDATNVACDIPNSHIVNRNDFTLLKTIGSYTYAVRFQYSQSTTSNTVFYKGSLVNPSSNTLETYVVEIGPDSDIENTLVRLIGKYEVSQAT